MKPISGDHRNHYCIYEGRFGPRAPSLRSGHAVIGAKEKSRPVYVSTWPALTLKAPSSPQLSELANETPRHGHIIE